MFTTLFLSWKAPAGSWFPVGRLTYTGSVYIFRYTVGAYHAHRSGFRGISPFPNWDEMYQQSPPFDILTEPEHSPRADQQDNPHFWEDQHPTTPFRWPATPEAGRDDAYLELYPPPVRRDVDGTQHIEIDFFVRKTHRMSRSVQRHWTHLGEPRDSCRIFRCGEGEFDISLLIIGDQLTPVGCIPHGYTRYIDQQLQQGHEYDLDVSRIPTDDAVFPHTFRGLYTGEVGPGDYLKHGALFEPLTRSDLEMPDDSSDATGYLVPF